MYCASHIWIFPFPFLLSLLKLFTITILFYFQSLNYSYLNPQVLPWILLPHPPGQGLERGRLGECMMVLSCKLDLNHSNSLYIPRKNLSHHPQQLKLNTIWCFLLFKFLYREFLCKPHYLNTGLMYWQLPQFLWGTWKNFLWDLKKKIVISPTTAQPETGVFCSSPPTRCSHGLQFFL